MGAALQTAHPSTIAKEFAASLALSIGIAYEKPGYCVDELMSADMPEITARF